MSTPTSLTSTPPVSPPVPVATPAAAAPATKPPSASLYVGDLSLDVSEAMLFEVFNNVGVVSSIRVCRDTHTRRSLGYAYVNFTNVIDAERALDTLNNQVIAGKPCRIMWSQRDPSIRKTGVGNIFIKNLDATIGHKELYDTFSAFGNILSCKVALDEHAKSKGYGFVHFESQQCAERAISTVNDKLLLSKKVYVGHFIPRKLRNQQLEQSWTNVYVKDIDSGVTTEDLKVAFSEFGEISSALVVVKDGNHLGFGYVGFVNHASAKAAVEKMHGQKLGNGTLYCARHQKKAERLAKLKKDWEQHKIRKYQGINLYLKNLEDEIDEERLRKEFNVFGTIKSCKIMTDDQGTSKGFGFICFSAPEESQRAIVEMNNRILLGCHKPLYVALHEPIEIRRQKMTANVFKPNMKPQHPGGIYPSQVMYQNSQRSFVYPGPMPQMPHWQTGGQVPMSVYPVNVMSRGGLAGASGPRGPGGNRGQRQGQQGQGRGRQQQMGAPEQGFVDIPLSQLKGYPLEQQKLALGERLYPLIALTHPQLAGKITGMFLDSRWSVEELYSLLTDEQKMAEKIEDALGVLERAQVQEHAQAPPVGLTPPSGETVEGADTPTD